MIPRRGRSRYLHDRVLGFPDLGTKAVIILLSAIADALLPKLDIWLDAGRHALYSVPCILTALCPDCRRYVRLAVNERIALFTPLEMQRSDRKISNGSAQLLRYAAERG